MKEEIIKYIEKLFLGSIMVTSDKYPECIFHVYNKHLLRERKLNRIVGNDNKKLIFNYNEVKDKIIFEQDYRNNHFCLDYDNVTSVLVEKYGCDYQEIREIINDWLKSDDKFSTLTTNRNMGVYCGQLKSDDKLNQLTDYIHYKHFE